VLVFCVNLGKKIHLPLSNTKQAAMDISGFLVDFPWKDGVKDSLLKAVLCENTIPLVIFR
jgi:hypothetical protein